MPCRVVSGHGLYVDLLALTADDVIDSATLSAHGLHSHDLERLCRDGQLHRLVQGWFATRRPASPEDRHDLLMRALARHFDDRAAVSHHSRLVTLQLPTWRADLGVGHLVRVADRGCRSRRSDRVHPVTTTTGLHLISTAHGLAVPVAAAIVQTGLLNGFMDSLIAADAALFRELTDHDELEAAVALFAGHRGFGPVRAALRHADARHESAGETRMAHALRALGVAFTPQVWIDTARGSKRVDALLDEHPVVVEFDGRVKYPLPDGPDGRWRNPLFEEKRREDAIRDQVFEFVRVTWSELDVVAALGERVRAAVARVG